MKNEFRARKAFLRAFITLGAFARISVATATDGVTTSWFDESLEAWRTSSTGSGDWVTSAGRWTPGSVVRSYTLRGANDVSTPADDWDRITVSGDDDAASGTFRRAHKFFKVDVSLP